MRNRLSKLALAAALTVGTATAAGTFTAASASASTATQAAPVTTARQVSAAASLAAFFPHTQNGHAPLFRPNNSLWGTLPLNDEVEVTCYYLGSSPGWLNDGYEDHVVWVNAVGNFTGHIPDDYINFGGLTPPEEGVPPC